MIQPVTWRRAPVGWHHLPSLVLWAPHGSMHPACDPRNAPPPEGWHWPFLVQAKQEEKSRYV